MKSSLKNCSLFTKSKPWVNSIFSEGKHNATTSTNRIGNAKANYEEKEILYLQRTDQLETPEIEEVNFDED